MMQQHDGHVGHDRHAGHDARAGHDAHVGHDKHAGHSVAKFRDKFWLSLILTIPVLIWGHMLPRVLGYTAPAVPRARWISPVLGTVVFLYGGWPSCKGPSGNSGIACPG
jgi:Cu2+-exporting ATPase